MYNMLTYNGRKVHFLHSSIIDIHQKEIRIMILGSSEFSPKKIKLMIDLIVKKDFSLGAMNIQKQLFVMRLRRDFLLPFDAFLTLTLWQPMFVSPS